MAGLLRYSIAEFLPIILAILTLRPRSTVVEIGSEAGYMTHELVRMVENGIIGTLSVIEPTPEAHLSDLLAHENISLYPATSLETLPGIPLADVYLVDGDHNYYTVFHEATHILDRCDSEGRPAALVFHDVCWPCDRRDLYYAPERIPPEFLHEHSYDLGVTLGCDEVVEGGFRSLGKYAVARRRGGPRNGVRTALEDALFNRSRWRLFIVPAIFGLGVVVPTDHPDYARIVQYLSPYLNNPLIGTLEENRLQLFLKVIELQDRLADVEARNSKSNRTEAK